MPDAPILGGAAAKKVKLDEDAFGARFLGPLVHQSVRAEQAARRRGTAATKTRGMVSGGGAKPWRQKGTGRARAGSNRSPIWTGGGTAFGPKPRSYTFKVNRKEQRAALRSALSLHAERGSIAILDAARVQGAEDAPGARPARGLGPDRARRSSCSPPRSPTPRCPSATSRAWPCSQSESVGVTDLLGAASLLVSEPALAALTERPASARDRPGRRGAAGGEGLMDHTQVIIRPVVSEKSYVLSAADRYTFRVHPDAHKTQIRQAVEALFDVHVVEVQDDERQAQAQATRHNQRADARMEEGHRAAARGRADPDLPGPGGPRLGA